MDSETKPPSLDYRGPVAQRIPIPRDPESIRWLAIRILFRIGLFVVLSPIAFYFGPNLINFGQLTSPTPADLAPRIARMCVPTIRAMKEYQRDTGRWPNQVKDLVPHYLSEMPPGQFIEDRSASGKPPNLMCILFPGDHRVTYDFTPSAEGWYAQGPFTYGPIPLPPVTISAASAPAATPR